MAAMLSLPPSRVCSIWWNPSPCFPRRFCFGTRQSLKNSSPVFEERQTIFLCIVLAVKPGVPLGTKMQLNSFFPSGLLPVTAWTIQIALISEEEFVIKILLPLMTHLSLSRTAEVFEAPASEPALGSVSPKAASFLPAQRSGSHSRFCSSLPKA